MFKRERQIWNLQEKISRQKDYIEDLETIRDYYRIMTREQRDTINMQDKTITRQDNLINNMIKELYSNVKTDKQKIDKLKELVSDWKSLN